MTDQYPAKITSNGSRIDAVLICEEGGILELDLDGYKLETVGFYQNWEITEDSFNAFGNKFGFKISGDDHEVADLEVIFSLPMQVFDQDNESTVVLNINLEYGAIHLKVTLTIDGIDISAKGNSLENAFIELCKILSEKNQMIRSCFSCALSGYERGGASLFCMKGNRTALLADSYIDGYRNWFQGMSRSDVSEMQQCDDYEFAPDRKKY